MLIRRYKENEIDHIVELWYKVSIIAHNFISEKYWEAGKKQMHGVYIPMSDTYVIEDNENIAGFISMVDNYLAAIFIGTQYQNKGYGKKLLDYIKEQKDYLELKVYKKNSKTVDFYLKNGFEIKEESMDEDTKEAEYFMKWVKHLT